MNFSNILTHWYSDKKRLLPWRLTKEPYFVWLSEIILQQTQVNQGLPYYNAFTEQFPNVFTLANASENEVLKLWQGLGYYSRARNLHYTAKYIANELNGKFPTNYKDLLKLKGVGDYTASAIASICFEEPCAVLDGNVYRVLSRYYGITTPINTSQGVKEFKTLAQSLLPLSNVGDHNQAIMEFGAIQCKPKSPNCDVCPLNVSCVAFKNNSINELPVKLKKLKVKHRYLNYLVYLTPQRQTVLEQRIGNGIWRGLYEFPKIETSKSVGYNSIKLQLKHDFESLSLYNEVDIVHKLSHQHLHTKFWIVETNTLPKKGIDSALIDSFAVPVLIQNFIKDFNF